MFVYYGTADYKLVTNGCIDPEYVTGKIFEFGNGFYVSFNKKGAERYPKIAAINKRKKSRSNYELGYVCHIIA